MHHAIIILKIVMRNVKIILVNMGLNVFKINNILMDYVLNLIIKHK